MITKSVISIGRSSELYEISNEIWSQCSEVGIPLALCGGLAIWYMCNSYPQYSNSRADCSDIDFAALSEDKGNLKTIMESNGWFEHELTATTPSSNRAIYIRKEDDLHCDVFFDEAIFNHKISFRKYILSESNILPISILLLQKLQIVELSEKDLVDLLGMFHSALTPTEFKFDETIIVEFLSKDWGFYQTTMENLEKLRRYTISIEKLKNVDCDGIIDQIDALQDIILNSEKTTGWKLRSMIGNFFPHYKLVEQVR